MYLGSFFVEPTVNGRPIIFNLSNSNTANRIDISGRVLYVEQSAILVLDLESSVEEVDIRNF